MPTNLEQLQPADKRIVGIYLPYYNQQKNEFCYLERSASIAKDI